MELEAIFTFFDMVEHGEHPNQFCFSAAIQACSNVKYASIGLGHSFADGWQWFCRIFAVLHVLVLDRNKFAIEGYFGLSADLVVGVLVFALFCKLLPDCFLS